MKVVVRAMPEQHETSHQAIGARVRLIRERSEISQRELARQLDVSPSYLSAVERGVDKINVEIIRGMLRYFPGLNIDWIISGRGSQFINPENDEVHEFRLDLRAIEAARHSFYSSLRHADAEASARIIATEAIRFQCVYGAYMSRLRQLLNEEVPEKAAHELARAFCDDPSNVGLIELRMRSEHQSSLAASDGGGA